jgi:hypothetical protein
VAADPTRVVVLTRPGCHLCEDVIHIVARVCEELQVSWCERDITQDPVLLASYREQIPVTLIDGLHHDFWRVNEGRLRAALG